MLHEAWGISLDVYTIGSRGYLIFTPSNICMSSVNTESSLKFIGAVGHNLLGYAYQSCFWGFLSRAMRRTVNRPACQKCSIQEGEESFKKGRRFSSRNHARPDLRVCVLGSIIERSAERDRWIDLAMKSPSGLLQDPNFIIGKIRGHILVSHKKCCTRRKASILDTSSMSHFIPFASQANLRITFKWYFIAIHSMGTLLGTPAYYLGWPPLVSRTT